MIKNEVGRDKKLRMVDKGFINLLRTGKVNQSIRRHLKPDELERYRNFSDETMRVGVADYQRGKGKAVLEYKNYEFLNSDMSAIMDRVRRFSKG